MAAIKGLLLFKSLFIKLYMFRLRMVLKLGTLHNIQFLLALLMRGMLNTILIALLYATFNLFNTALLKFTHMVQPYTVLYTGTEAIKQSRFHIPGTIAKIPDEAISSCIEFTYLLLNIAVITSRGT